MSLFPVVKEYLACSGKGVTPVITFPYLQISEEKFGVTKYLLILKFWWKQKYN